MDAIIIGMWITTFVLMAGFVYVVGNGLFYLFALAFCTLDNYLQDRYWAKRGYTKDIGEDGQTWYISGLD